MGYGWRTSLHQTLHKVLYNGEVEFVYTDGDGTEHFFKKNKDDQKKYSDQSGLSLTLEVGDENITITDKGDNVMTFPLVIRHANGGCAGNREGADSEDSGCGRQRSHGDGAGGFAAENRVCDGRRGSRYDVPLHGWSLRPDSDTVAGCEELRALQVRERRAGENPS